MTERFDRAELLQRLERYYDTVPRAAAEPEDVGPFTSFRPGPVTKWQFYARPRLGYDGDFTADDVRRVLARRAEQGLARNVEWVEEVTPTLWAAVAEAVGDKAHRYPLLVRRDLPPSAEPERVSVMTPDHPDLAASVGAVHASFGETDDLEPAELTGQPDLIASGELIMVAAYDDEGVVVGGGSASPRGEVCELMGIGVIPRARGRGLGTATTEALTRATLRSGATTVFLSAGSDGAASIYRRVGFEDVGTACILELDD
ncbi:GNAT family N-acetyltransferase [Nocardioides bigeumensis]|uniref:N-acetyltransferase domain-containing protein n=1 Tax=Nocardioides bigeumensis TaxID=433657 RepID=A0ABN2Y7N1_9ACTN